MKKLVFYICYLSALYLVFHIAVFMITGYSNKDFTQEKYQRGECQKTYYSLNF